MTRVNPWTSPMRTSVNLAAFLFRPGHCVPVRLGWLVPIYFLLIKHPVVAGTVTCLSQIVHALNSTWVTDVFSRTSPGC